MEQAGCFPASGERVGMCIQVSRNSASRSALGRRTARSRHSGVETLGGSAERSSRPRLPKAGARVIACA
jgi:hypothetical protein